MKTSELTGAALDWAVAMCEGLLAFGYRTDGERFAVEDSDGQVEGFMPSTDWADGGPIVEREGISIESQTMRGADGKFAWCAALTHEDNEFDGIARAEEYGPTPLIAAMRCYVASKLGDEVDVPEVCLDDK